LNHPSVAEASVVGLPNEKYGEVVSAFLRSTDGKRRPADAEIQKWVGDTLGRHKIPVHVFWVGKQGVLDDFPKTGSGKHQKHILRDIGKGLLQSGRKECERARL
jgi:acyl-coenzyme A synthetase/AMP-(fatty) acid ligase